MKKLLLVVALLLSGCTVYVRDMHTYDYGSPYLPNTCYRECQGWQQDGMHYHRVGCTRWRTVCPNYDY
jgi:hypothetical protein